MNQYNLKDAQGRNIIDVFALLSWVWIILSGKTYYKSYWFRIDGPTTSSEAIMSL